MRTLLQQLDGDIAECERVVEFSQAKLKKAVKIGDYREALMRTELIARHTAMAKRLRSYRDAYLREIGRDELTEAVKSLLEGDYYPI